MQITARKLEEKDLPKRVELMNQEFIYKTMAINIPISMSETTKWFMANMGNGRRTDFTFLDEQGQYLGMGGLVDIDQQNKRAELYIFADPDIKGKGFGQRATAFICNYGFVKYNLNKIFLFTLGMNEVANHIYSKLGFQKEGVFRKHQYQYGTYQDKNLYSLLNEDWQQQAWATPDKIDFKF